MKQIPIYFLAVTAVCVVASMRNAVALPALACRNAQHLFCLVVAVQMV